MADSATPNLPANSPNSVPGGRALLAVRRILLIDDDSDILEVTVLALCAAGFTVESCSDSSRAVGAALSFQPDLILLDAMMPVVDGPEVLRRLRCEAGTVSIPVVFVTARVDSEAVRDYLQLGAVAVIGKPFDPLAMPAQLSAIAEQLG